MNYYSSLVVILSLIFLAGCEPRDRRPGTWTKGEIVEDEITDWSFSNEQQEVFLQTQPWYGIPHSVTTVVATTNDTLYVPSIYYDSADPYPEGKYWNGIIVSNPAVLIKIDDKRYPRVAERVTDPVEFEAAFAALASKYPFWQKQYDDPESAVTFYIIRLGRPSA